MREIEGGVVVATHGRQVWNYSEIGRMVYIATFLSLVGADSNLYLFCLDVFCCAFWIGSVLGTIFFNTLKLGQLSVFLVLLC